jgi:RNA-directed DNA polymerase
VKTQKAKLIKAFKEFDQWIKKVRNQLKLKQIWKLTRAKLMGHINYFGYWMNATKLNHFYYQVVKSLFKWLNRRSQKRSYTWEGFEERLKHFPLIEPIEHRKLKQLGWNPYV